MPEIASSGEAPKNKPAIKQDILMQKKSGTIDRKMVGGSERLKEITKNQLGALDSVVINQNIIKRFGNRAANIRERFDTLNAQYKEDTGLVMKGMDKIVGVFGGETVQSTYESMIGNLQREAAAMLREIDSIVPKVVRHFTRDQVAEMNITLRTLSGILGDTLNVPTFGEMAGTTARSLGSAENWKDGASNALHGAKGVLEGVTESVWMVIKSIPDLAIFCYNFATQESTRDATAKFMVGVGGFITENAWKGETWTKASVIIGDTISKEMKRIATLPQGEQAEAIGRIPGLIIGALVGGGIVLKGAAKFGKGMEALGTTIQKAEGATKLKKVGGKILEKTGALAVGVGETGDLVFGAKRLKKKKIREGESTSTNGIPEALNQRISEMSARLLAVGSKESTLNPDIAKMLLQMRKDLIATENAGNMQQVEALLKKADTYFDTHNRLMFPDQRLIHDPHAREIQSRIFAMMTNYSAHRPLSELGPRGREIGDEADRLYRELQRALASKNPEQFDKILKDCDRFQQNPDKYLDGQTVETIDEVVNTLGDVGENQIINNGDVIDWSKDIGEKLVQLKEFLGDMKSIPITKLKQFLDDLGLSLKNSVHLSSGVSLKMTEKIVQIRQRFFPVDGLFVKGQMINYRLGDGSIGKVRLERWNEQTGLWDVSWKDKNGVIRMQKDRV